MAGEHLPLAGLRPLLGGRPRYAPGPRGARSGRTPFGRALATAQNSRQSARWDAGAVPPGALAHLPNGLGPLVQAAARRYGLDPTLLAGVIQTESGFNSQAVSPAGAKGLMQLMDATARGLGVEDPFNPVQNVMGGARFLRQLLDRYGGDERLALAAYNAGPGAVDRYGGIPPYAETQRFVPSVLAAAARHRTLARTAAPET